MILEKKDFVEIDFTGRVKDGGVFDSTIKKDLEELHSGHDHPIETKPFIFPLGEGMFLKSLEDFLIGKDMGKYTIELAPEKAFGVRNAALIQMVPMKIFREHKTAPYPGAMLNFDGRVGKVVTVSGGRVMIDFNNPLAGKTVVYYIEVRRKITDINEKVRALNDFLFRQDIDFTVEGKKLTLKTDKKMRGLAEMFKDTFKEILDLDLEVVEVEKKE
jgi:FKBP-type peptidyl-prolyl cis-trans isomerase 2